MKKERRNQLLKKLQNKMERIINSQPNCSTEVFAHENPFEAEISSTEETFLLLEELKNIYQAISSGRDEVWLSHSSLIATVILKLRDLGFTFVWSDKSHQIEFF